MKKEEKGKKKIIAILLMLSLSGMSIFSPEIQTSINGIQINIGKIEIFWDRFWNRFLDCLFHRNSKKEAVKNPEQDEIDKYNQALYEFKDGDFENAIQTFITIDKKFSDIENVMKSLSLCLIEYVNKINVEINDILYKSTEESMKYKNAVTCVNNGLYFLSSIDFADEKSYEILQY